MSKLYILGCVFVGIGTTLCYVAGRHEAQDEIKDMQAKTWTEATGTTDKE